MKKKTKKIKKKKRILKPKKAKLIRLRKKKIKKIAKKAVRHRKSAKLTKVAKFPTSESPIRKIKVRIIGIGGGGSSIVSEITQRVKRVDFVVANTDSRALKGAAKKAKRFQFGRDLTQGLGTGMNVELGEMAAQNEKEKIKKLFEGQDLCIIIASLGGGTGSGATPIFAKVSKGSGCLTYGIFTLPFEFEGKKKMEIAKESLLKIKPYLNAFSIIPNERIFQNIDKNTPLKEALSAINKKLAENLQGLIEMVYLPGLINIDFADLKTVFQRRGRLTYLNTIEIEEVKGEGAIKKLISGPLYSYTIKGARGILYNITGGQDIPLSEVSQISEMISRLVNKKAKIIFGISQNPKYQGRVGITLLAAGCAIKNLLTTSKHGKKPSDKKPKPEKEKSKTKKGTRKTKKTQPLEKSPKPKSKPKPKPKSKSKSEPEPKPKPEPKKPTSLKKPRPKKKIKVKALPEKTARPKKTKKAAKTPFAGVEKVNPVRDYKDRKKAQSKQISNGVKIEVSTPKPTESVLETVRRSALEVRKKVEEEEKELLEKEKFWETPAILRRKSNR